jgi:hypothetical protein
MSDKLQARTRVRVVLDIYPTDTWGQECELTQVYKQGKESAVNELRRVLKEWPGNRVRIVGEPEVEAVIATKEGA